VEGRPARARLHSRVRDHLRGSRRLSQRQGFNSISFIAAFPNWDADHRGATFANTDSVYLRNAWEKFGHWAADARITTADGALTTAKDMADEQGNRPFAVLETVRGSPTSIG